MSDSRLNKTGLAYFYNRLKTVFASKSALETLEDRVDDIVTTGGEPNVIDSIKVNGTAQTVTNKTVDITVPTAVTDLTDANDYATKDYVDTNGGKIDTISVNGTDQTITNKKVDITMPTKVSDLNNDSGFQTAAQVQTAIGNAVSSAYKYKGSVATYSALPANPTTGDVYDVQETGMNYAWNGSAWDALGQLIDTSILWTTTNLTAITTAEIDAIVV